MRVALGHLVGLGCGRRIAVVGTRGRIARRYGIEGQPLGVIRDAGHALAGGKILRNGQLIDNRPAIVADEIDRLAGGKGKIGIESTVMGPSAGIEQPALAGPQRGREVIFRDEALAKLRRIVREVAAAELDGSHGRVVNLDPASPAAVVVDYADAVRLRHHLGDDQVGHVLGAKKSR